MMPSRPWLAGALATALLGTGCGQKPLQERDDALFEDVMGLIKTHQTNCDALGKAASELVARESATVDEMAAAFEKMNDAEKQEKRSRDQARARNHDKGLLLLTALCSVKSPEFKQAMNKVSPATAMR